MRHPEQDPKLEYIRALYAPEDEVLQEIAAYLAGRDLHIHIHPEEGKLLQILIRMHGVKQIAEIGTLAGYSAIWMARALPEDGHIHTIDRQKKHVDISREMIAKANLSDSITVHHGDALEVLEALGTKQQFDMVFIDAEKLQYMAYLEWAEAHLKPGGLIVADNTLLFGAVYEEECPDFVRPTTWKVMRECNAALADPKRFCSLMLPTLEGLTIAIKR